MSKVTVIWTSPYRIFYLSQRLLLGLAWGGGLLVVALLVVTALFAANYIHLESVEGKYIKLRDEVESRESGLGRELADRGAELVKSNRELAAALTALRAKEEQLDHARQRLEEIRELETKIRRFLGLGQPAGSESQAHQGGLADTHPGSGLEGTDGAAGSPESSLIKPSANSLRARLEEILDHLETRRELSLKMPTILPVKGEDLWLASGFGWRQNPFGRGQHFHNGVDIAGPSKAEIIAPADGVVQDVGNGRGLGNYIKLKHNEHLETVYLHLYSAGVNRGQKVKRGDVIGLMGNTGRSTGTHLHYSVVKDGKHTDPMNYIWDRSSQSLSLVADPHEVF